MSKSLWPMDCSPQGSSVAGILQVKILEWVAVASSRGSSWPRDGTQVSCTAGGFFTVWATREALVTMYWYLIRIYCVFTMRRALYRYHPASYSQHLCMRQGLLDALLQMPTPRFREPAAPSRAPEMKLVWPGVTPGPRWPGLSASTRPSMLTGLGAWSFALKDFPFVLFKYCFPFKKILSTGFTHNPITHAGNDDYFHIYMCTHIYTYIHQYSHNYTFLIYI